MSTPDIISAIGTAIGGVNLLAIVVMASVSRNDITWIKSELNKINAKIYNGLSEELAELRGHVHHKVV